MCMNLVRHTHRRYREAMRTNIEIDDELMAKALKLSDLKTKKAVVHKALQEFVELRGTNRAILEFLEHEDPDNIWPEVRSDYEEHRVR